MTGLGRSIANTNYSKGVIDTLVSLVKEGIMQLTDAAKKANISEDEFSKLLEEKKG